MVAQLETTTIQKALSINIDASAYGTFAEIGAGQEVARFFFEAGRASGTVAKTISAYDMVFSDAIYGKEKHGRYVCQSRLEKMLDYEYKLLEERLGSIRGDKTRFFSYANTVTTGSKSRNLDAHGWMGVQFQLHPQGPVNQIVLHLRMKDQAPTLQRECLGVVGVNLIHAALQHTGDIDTFMKALTDNIDLSRLEIDMLRFRGEDLKHIDNRLLVLKLVENSYTNAAMFAPNGEVLYIADALFKKPVFVQRGSFSPVTNIHVDMIESGLQFLQSAPDTKGKDFSVLLELTINNLKDGDKIEQKDYLDRIDTMCTLGHTVLISNYFLFYELKQYLEKFTNETIAMILGANLLSKLIDDKYYSKISGGVLEGIGKLTSLNAKLLIYPYRQVGQKTLRAANFPVPAKAQDLFNYLLHNKFIIDIDCNNGICEEIHSETVLELIEKHSKDWEQYVPPKVVKIIKERKLFGYSA